MELVFVCDNPVKNTVELSEVDSTIDSSIKTTFILKDEVEHFIREKIRNECDRPLFINYENFKTIAKNGNFTQFITYTLDQTIYKACWDSIKYE